MRLTCVGEGCWRAVSKKGSRTFIRAGIRDHPGMARTVLIVDDHAGFRRTARRMLEAEGYEVVGEAPDGRSAKAMTPELDPEVVILDVGLPDCDGFELAPRLSRNGHGPASCWFPATTVRISARRSPPAPPSASSQRESFPARAWRRCFGDRPAARAGRHRGPRRRPGRGHVAVIGERPPGRERDGPDDVPDFAGRPVVPPHRAFRLVEATRKSGRHPDGRRRLRWLVNGASASDEAWLFTFGLVTGALPYAFLIHLLLLYWGAASRRPGTAASSRSPTSPAPSSVLPNLFLNPGDTQDCDGCPDNLLLVNRNPTLGDIAMALLGAASVLILVALPSPSSAAGGAGPR